MITEAPEQIEAPIPGLHRDVPAATYHRWSGMSHHRLCALARSPKFFQHDLKTPMEPTPAMILGEAIHLAVLEPEIFAERVVVAPDCDRRTKEGKAMWAAFQAEAAGKIVLDEDDCAKCVCIADAVKQCRAANTILEARTETEISGVWTDPATGISCKMRADGVSPDWETAIDLKSTADASRKTFEKSIYNFAYHRQGAHYIDGLAANGIKLEHFIIIAVEKDPPYHVAVYRLADEVIARGREENRQLLKRFKECRDADVWPGLPDEIQDIYLPKWAEYEQLTIA